MAAYDVMRSLDGRAIYRCERSTMIDASRSSSCRTPRKQSTVCHIDMLVAILDRSLNSMVEDRLNTSNADHFANLSVRSYRNNHIADIRLRGYPSTQSLTKVPFQMIRYYSSGSRSTDKSVAEVNRRESLFIRCQRFARRDKII